MVKTLKYRLKDAGVKNKLLAYSRAVNFVWNYCNEMTEKKYGQNRTILSRFDLHLLTAGCSKEIKLNSKSIASVCDVYSRSRNKAKKIRLKWRSQKRSLGWIPFKGNTIQLIDTGKFIYDKKVYRFWESVEIDGKIRCGRFSQDARGRWYISFIVESKAELLPKTGADIGVDLGLKTTAVYSNGDTFIGIKQYQKYEKELGMANRANKRKRLAAINCKIKNIRKDSLDKETTRVLIKYDRVFVGNVSSKKLSKSFLAKSIFDVGWGMYRLMLDLKAKRLGREVVVVKENYSTVTCSSCLQRTGPSGLSALGVREWTCGCGSVNDRDVNAARNILRMGLHTLKEESPKMERRPTDEVIGEEIRRICEGSKTLELV